MAVEEQVDLLVVAFCFIDVGLGTAVSIYGVAVQST